MSDDAENIQGCTVKLIKSGNPGCDVVSSGVSSSLRLKSKRQGLQVFSAGVFAFMPQEKLTSCVRKPTRRGLLESGFKKGSIHPKSARVSNGPAAALYYFTIGPGVKDAATATATLVPFPCTSITAAPIPAASPATATNSFPTNIGIYSAATNPFATTTGMYSTATFVPFPCPPITTSPAAAASRDSAILPFSPYPSNGYIPTTSSPP
ncbi:hypothetical protein NL676_014758 [Syzygium grande]|nr:hypothetical protein NL676_014758 [Syzygium grande]